MPEPKNRLSPFDKKVARNVALNRAAELIGQTDLAFALGVRERSLRAYLSLERGEPPHAMRLTARALEAGAAELLALAKRCRDLEQ